MKTIKLLLSDLINAIRGGCWLNHCWQPVIDDGRTIEYICLRCGKQASRNL